MTYRPKTIVALSGGVDSAVSAAILKKQGYPLIAVHLKFWSEKFSPSGGQPVENKCCSISAAESARRTAAFLQIPFYILNFREPFRRKVVDYFLRSYAKNLTPNPCVACNREIKFGRLLTKMHELGCAKIATGHFARVRRHGGNFELLRGRDRAKDQSYFLSALSQNQLAHTIFPVGDKTKSEVRQLAQKFGLEHLNAKKESVGVCFFPEREPREFLQRHLPRKVLRAGTIRTKNGKAVGRHRGLALFTIGQRRGVDLGGMSEPFYVAGFNRTKNEIIVGPDAELFKRKLRARNLSWIGEPPADGAKINAQIRYRSPAGSARIWLKKTGAEIEFMKPQRAITPGQIVAFFIGEKCLGSGEIC